MFTTVWVTHHHACAVQQWCHSLTACVKANGEWTLGTFMVTIVR